MSSTTDNEQRFAYLLSPEFQIVNTAGKPLTGGWIEVYIHGTRVKYYCFSDFDGTLHPFQIPLDSLGSNIVLASPTHAYDIYIYNKFGALVMSRYNVVPACNAADIVEDVVVIDSPDETINVTCDGGSNWHLEVNTDLIATTEQLDSVSGDLQDQIDGKKDLQQPYSASGTVTQTITKIEQNENGNIEVTYANIELPPEVPNVNIVSPDGTIDVTSSTDQQTNTKTFEIDVHNRYMQHFIGYYGPTRYEDRQPGTTEAYYLNVNNWSDYEYEGDFIYNNWQGDNNPWFYVNPGLYMVHAVVHYAMASGSLANEDKYIKVATGQHNGWEDGTRYKDFSHEAQLTDASITVNFIRKVDEHNGGIEIAPYLPYGVSYAYIHEIQIVKLDSIAYPGGGGGRSYAPGYGIEIPDYTIQIDPSVVVTHNYFTTAINQIQEEINNIETTITNVTGDLITREEFNVVTGDVNNINEAITNIIGATGDYATHDYVDAAVSGLENYSAGQYISIEDHVISVTGLQPEGDYATIEQLEAVSGDVTHLTEIVNNITNVTGDFATVEYVDNRIATAAGDVYEAGQYISIDNNVISVTGLQPEGDYATRDELNEVIETVNNVTGDITNINEAITNIIGATGDYATEEYVNNAVSAVSGTFTQQQSDWTQTDDTQVDYIKHKPEETNLVAGDNIAIEVTNNEVIISATGIPSLEGYATEQYVDEAVAAVTGQPFEQVNSDWLATSGVAEILNKPDVFQLIAGDNIDITPSGNDLVISASSDVTKAYVDEQIAVATGMIPEDTVTHTELNDAIDAATGMIPEAQVNADWLATSGKAEILNKPQEEAVEFEEVNLSDYALASAIPDVSNFVTQQDIDESIAPVQSQVDTLAAATGDYLQSSDLDGYATEQYVNDAIDAATGLIPQDTVTHVELADAIDSATALIPDVSSFVTQQDIDDSIAPVQSQIDTIAAATGDYITSLDGYATEQYVDAAVDTVTGMIPDIAPIQSQIDELAAATGDYLTEQVNADWTATSGVSEILNKPETEAVEFEEVDLDNYALASAIPSLDGYATETYVDEQIATVTGIIPSDVVTEQELADAIDAATGIIPDVTQLETDVANLVAATGEYATEAYVDAAVSAVTGGSFEQVNSDWNATSGVAEILNKPEIVDYGMVEISAGEGISIVSGVSGITISATGQGGAEYTAGQYIEISNNTISVTGVQPAGNYATEADLQTVSGAIPESEEVQFEEVDLSIYTLASSVPDVTVLEADIQTVSAAIPSLAGYATESYVDESVTAVQAQIDTLATATGDYLQDSDLNGYATESYVDSVVTGYATETDLQTVSGAIPDTSAFATEVDLQTVSGAVDSVSAAIPESEAIEFEEVDLSEYATEAYVDAAITGASFEQVNADWNATSGVAEILNKPEIIEYGMTEIIAGEGISIVSGASGLTISATGQGGSSYTAGQYIEISNNTISVTGLQPAGDYATEVDLQTVSGAIPETEEVQFEEVDLSDYATETYVNAAVSGKQDILTGITDVQVVNSLPVSPVSTVLYLIPEA